MRVGNTSVRLIDRMELQPTVSRHFAEINNHGILLLDRSRMGAFKRAISAAITSDSVVIDIGAGTGVLSLIALDAGARHVYLIEENENILCYAEKLLTNRYGKGDFTLVHGRSTAVDLPEVCGKADLLMSETLGTLAFNEGILSTLSDACARFLKPSGIVIPSMVALRAQPLCVRSVGSTANSYLSRERLRKQELMKGALSICAFRFPGSPSSAVFEVAFKCPPVATGLVLWMDAELKSPIRLSCAPWHQQASFGYVVVPFNGESAPLEVIVAGRIGHRAMSIECRAPMRKVYLSMTQNYF